MRTRLCSYHHHYHHHYEHVLLLPLQIWNPSGAVPHLQCRDPQRAVLRRPPLCSLAQRR